MRHPWRPRGRLIHRLSRGQSLVEFALVLPLLMVLLLGIADFGRVFSAGITLEAAARNGAEAAALERLRNPPTSPGDPAYYEALHRIAARTACEETALLPNSTAETAKGDPPTSAITPGQCPDFVGNSGTFYPGMVAVRVCVMDGADPSCGDPIPGYGPTIPADPATGQSRCPKLQAFATSATNTSPGQPVSHMVEVSTCYHFTTLFNLHVALPFSAGLNLGDIWLERTRTFVVDCPPGPVNAC